MYTVPAKVSVQTKTLISAFEKGEVKTLNVEETDEAPKPIHPELVKDELAEPGTAKKLLLAFELKRQEREITSASSLKSPTGRLSLEQFSNFEDKSVKVTVEKQTNGILNGNDGVTVTVTKTEVTVDHNGQGLLTDSDIQVEKKIVEISATNGDEKSLKIEETVVSASVQNTAAESKIEEVIKQEIVERIENKVEEKVQEKIEEKVQEKIEEKVQEKVVEKVQEKVEEKVQEKIEEKVDNSLVVTQEKVVKEEIKETIEKKIEEQITEVIVEKVEEKVEEKIQEKLEEKGGQKVEETIQEKKEEKIKDATVSVSVTKTTEVSVEMKLAKAKTESKLALIVSAVKPEGGLDKALRYASMKALEDQGHSVIYTDAHNIPRNQRGGPDFEEERKKLLEAHLVILHFRPILNSPPAALKLWLEGTLVHSDGTFIDRTLLKGKKAIILVTTDAEKVPDERLLSLPFLASVQDDILRAIALDVITPFIIFGVGQDFDEATQKDHLSAWEQRLASAFL